jgi:small multidrug resistance pump
MAYVFLLIAIIAEVIATMLLKSSQAFTRIGYGLGSLFAYGICFYFLSHVMNTLPVGLVYAIWSGLGIVLIAIVGYFAFGQKLDLPAIVGIAMIFGGVLVMNLLSKSVAH